jgi:putative transposase
MTAAENESSANLPDHDHRAIKRIIERMMGFKDFRCARIILSGIEVMNMKDDGVAQTVAT